MTSTHEHSPTPAASGSCSGVREHAAHTAKARGRPVSFHSRAASGGGPVARARTAATGTTAGPAPREGRKCSHSPGSELVHPCPWNFPRVKCRGLRRPQGGGEWLGPLVRTFQKSWNEASSRLAWSPTKVGEETPWQRVAGVASSEGVVGGGNGPLKSVERAKARPSVFGRTSRREGGALGWS